LALALDTHVLVWIATGDSRLSSAARKAIEAPDSALFVSGAIAWEYADLEQRGRFPGSGPLPGLQDQLGFALLDVPADLFRLAGQLPPIHRDPVDRMLIAQAMRLDLTIVTADRTIRRYPVKTLW
jgi:PIN domain nuclease of toxin-antitoxin system